MDEKKTNYLKELKNNTSILLSVVLGIIFGLILTMVDKFNIVLLKMFVSMMAL